MFKYHKFTFTELNSKDHWVDFPCFGETLTSVGDHCSLPEQVDIQLNPSEVYQLSMDQSSTNTGIFIKNYRNTEAYLIEKHRDKGETAENFIFDLEQFLHLLCEGQTLSHVIYEHPIKTRSFRSAQVLFQLEGMILALPKRYPEFKTPKIDNIENSSWRSVVVDESLAQGTRKERSRLSVHKVWSWTRDYGYSLGNDEDVYEAFGIMMGWFYKSFDPLGRPYVRGEASKSTIGVLVLPTITGEQALQMLKEAGIEAQMLVANPANSIYRNLAVMVEHYKVLCVEFRDPYSMLSICIESNIMWANYECLTVVLSDATYVNPKLNELAGGEFHFVI